MQPEQYEGEVCLTTMGPKPMEACRIAVAISKQTQIVGLTDILRLAGTSLHEGKQL